MNIVFFGTSQFAVSALRKIKACSHSVAAVVTQPDRKSGRRLKISASPVKEEAGRLNMPIYQVPDIADGGFIEKLKSFGADFFVVVGFGEILPRKMLDIPRFCCVNIHASLLPKYRGAAPIKWALINGEKKTGVTVIRMNEELDAGDIVLQKEVFVEANDTSQTLDNKLASIGADLLIEALELISKDKASFIAQDGREATFAPRLAKKDGKIDWNQASDHILNRIRALKPWPGTYSLLDCRVLRIHTAEIKTGDDFRHLSPGQVAVANEDSGLIVKTGDGALSVLELQLEGKKPMPAELFLRGHKITVGTKLG